MFKEYLQINMFTIISSSAQTNYYKKWRDHPKRYQSLLHVLDDLKKNN